MQPTYEQYRSGCRMTSLLTNLEVQVFDTHGVLQLRYARYDLPTVLERLKAVDEKSLSYCQYVMQESGGKCKSASPLS